MGSLVESFTHRGITVEIRYDDSGTGNPREWDNGTKMSLTHRRYDLPNEINFDPDEHGLRGMAEVEAFIRKEYDVVGFKWVRGYDHGELCLSTSTAGAYSDPWDSGVAGFIFMDREGQRAMGTPDHLIDKVLDDDVATYDAWARGHVYGYVVDPDGADESCWGFIDDEKECRAEAIGVADDIANRRYDP